MKWNRISTPNFHILFDNRIPDQALRIADNMERIHDHVISGLGASPGRISILLQNQSVISNGFFSTSPIRSEFSMYPTQDIYLSGLLNWTDMLSIHEYRHVAQYKKSITGLNKIIFYLFGYSTSGIMAHMAIPEWFWEGDAVLTETELTEGGRGRIPNFSRLMRTNLIERGAFNYNLQYLGSYRLNIPDHYVTGYYFTTFLRRKYGNPVINKVLDKTWACPIFPFRFSGQLNKYTGRSLVNNYNLMLSELDSIWRDQIENLESTASKIIPIQRQNLYTDYEFPSFLNDGRIFALKSGIGDIQTFVVLDSTGREEKIFTPGITNFNGNPTTSGEIIAWNELAFDPRWPSRTYSEIKLHDLKSHTTKRITRRGRFSAAGISPDGKSIVSIRITPEIDYILEIIDTEEGKVAEVIDNPENLFYLSPGFSSEGSKITAIVQASGLKSIWIYDLASKKQSIVVGPIKENIGNPYLYEDYLFYNSPYSGIDNIYALNLRNEEIYQVTDSKFGAYNASVSKDGDKILFNNFGKNGMDIAIMEFDTAGWKRLGSVTVNSENYFMPLVSEKPEANVPENPLKTEYHTERYRKFKGIFNPYSWGPQLLSTDLNFLVGVNMQDIISTTAINAGYEFNANEYSGKWIANISYQGFYPVINAGGYTGNRSIDQRFLADSVQGSGDTLVTLSWRETGANAGLILPLNLTHSKFFEYLDIADRMNFNHITDYNYTERSAYQQGNGNFLSNSFSIRYQRILRRSQRDINSRFAQSIFFQYDHTPLGGDYYGQMISAETRLYFPGLFKHHSLNLRMGVLNQKIENDKGSYRFSSPLVYPRGYRYRAYEKIILGSVNYALPIAYPDFHVGPLINIQRIYANLFADYGYGRFFSNSETLASAGAEVYFDFNLMRYLPRFNIGIRYSYLPENQYGQFQILIGQFGF